MIKFGGNIYSISSQFRNCQIVNPDILIRISTLSETDFLASLYLVVSADEGTLEQLLGFDSLLGVFGQSELDEAFEFL